MDLTLGPLQFFWDRERWRDFYTRIIDAAPVARVVLGEAVCSKRLPAFQADIPEMAARLRDAGKDVLITSLALVASRHERRSTAELTRMGALVEVNDLTALALLPEGTAFAVGPLVNVYNEGTLRWLAARGARRVCLPPELPMASVARLAAEGAALGVAVEVWAFGRLPLAISARCYHARLHGRTKDTCRFVCAQDPDGRPIDTLEGQRFLAVNGVQTLSAASAFAGYEIAGLREAGVRALRLSPHSGDMAALCQAFSDALGGQVEAASLEAAARAVAPGGQLANGSLHGQPGCLFTRP